MLTVVIAAVVILRGPYGRPISGVGAGVRTLGLLLLAAALDTECVAEGVETAEQLDHLRRSGCSLAQGYLFSPAVGADRFDWTATY